MLALLTTGNLRSIGLILALAITASSSTGCAAASRHLSSFTNAWVVHTQEHHDLQRIREDTARELARQREDARRLAAEREVENARISSEREALEKDLCRANQEALQRRLKSNLKDTVESKVSFDVAQGLEVGELEVDTEALQALLKEREAQKKPPEQEPIRKQPCKCCDQPCGCRPGLLRRHCPLCRHKPCEAEKDCGGPEALTRLEQEPLQKPSRPAEIPMKLPVRLTFGMQQPQMEAARIRREPLQGNPQEPLERGPCTQPCPGANEGGLIPCTKPIGDYGHMPNQPSNRPEPTVDDSTEADDDTPPVPTPSAEEARRKSFFPFPGIKLGQIPLNSDEYAWQPAVGVNPMNNIESDR